MSLPIERWARNAHLLEAPSPRVFDDVDQLVQFERLRAQNGWKQRTAQAKREGPTAIIGGFAGLVAPPPAGALAAITGGVANVAWWSPSVYTPFPLNGLQAPEAFRLMAAGTFTSTAAGQTVTLNPAVGTVVAGVSLGSSSALALGSTVTAYWQLEADLTIRSIGPPGANSVAIGLFTLFFGTTAGATSTVTTSIFGLTAASFDATVAQGLLIAATPSATGISVTPQQVHFSSWN
jgi:hypothetical protein